MSFGPVISKSAARTKWILFQPFSIRKWITLLFIAFLAGTLAGGGSGTGGSGGEKTSAAKEKINVSSQPAAQINQKPAASQPPVSSKKWFVIGGLILIV